MSTTVATSRPTADEHEDWGWLAIRGAVTFVFGVLALVWPGMALGVLVAIFGVFAILDGVSALVFAATDGKSATGTTGTMMLVGLASLAAGLVAFLWPGPTSLAMLYVIALWAIIRGVSEVAAYVQLRPQLERGWLLLASGLLSVVFGVLLVAWPLSGVLAILWLIGVYGVVVGAVMVGLALSMRRGHRNAGNVEASATPA